MVGDGFARAGLAVDDLTQTGGQTAMALDEQEAESSAADNHGASQAATVRPVRVIAATPEELAAHEARLDVIDKLAAEGSVWRR